MCICSSFQKKIKKNHVQYLSFNNKNLKSNLKERYYIIHRVNKLRILILSRQKRNYVNLDSIHLILFIRVAFVSDN